MTPQKPCDSGNCQHNKRGDAPAVIGRAGSPPTSQDEQRRNHRDKKEDVIEIQSEAKTVTKVTLLHGFAAPSVVTFFTFVTVCNRF
jgi:hypothetical protein